MKKTGQIKNDSQQQRLLKLLQERGKAGVFVYEITTKRPDGLGIAQYNARISELREKGKIEGYDIDNVEPGHFVLKAEGSVNTQDLNTPLPPRIDEKQVPCIVDSCTIENHYKFYTKEIEFLGKKMVKEVAKHVGEPKQEQLNM